MISDVVLGLQYGDEGKGKIVHWLQTQERYDWIVRFSGGNNAGHTIVDGDKKYSTHFLPSINLSANPDVKAYLGPGMVIHPIYLYREIVELEKIFPGIGKKIFIDNNAFIIEDKHIQEDSETNKIGTTCRGIGPAYRDKIIRQGKRIKDLSGTYSSIYKVLFDLGVRFTDVENLNIFQIDHESKFLFEGAQGVSLDIDLGDYPFVTSSNCTTAPIVASGLTNNFRNIYGVFKPYVTRVGEGRLDYEMTNTPLGNKIIEVAHEYGTTTGRRRRVAELNITNLYKNQKLSFVNKLVVTKLDIVYNLLVNENINLKCWSGQVVKKDLFDISESNNFEEYCRYFVDKFYSLYGMEIDVVSYGPDTKDTKLMSFTDE